MYRFNHVAYIKWVQNFQISLEKIYSWKLLFFFMKAHKCAHTNVCVCTQTHTHTHIYIYIYRERERERERGRERER